MDTSDDPSPPPVTENGEAEVAAPLPPAQDEALASGDGGEPAQGGEPTTGPVTVEFEGEQFEVVEIDETAPPPEDDDDDDEDFGDNNEELLAEGVDGLAMEDEDERLLVGGGEEVKDTSSCTLEGHSDSIYSIATHRMADGSGVRVLMGGGDDVANLWNLTIAPLAAAEEESAAAAAAAAAGAGAAAEATAATTTSSSWGQQHTITSTNVATLGGHTDSVGSVAFSADGLLCATGGLDGLVKVWDAGTGLLKRTLEGPSDVEWLTWHSKGNVLLAGSSDGTVWMWLATSGACMQV